MPIKIGIYNGDGSSTKQTKINNEGDIYFSTSVKIANNSCSGKGCREIETISGKSWVKGVVDFENIPKLDVLEILQIKFYYKSEGSKYVDLVLRDIPVE